MGQDIPAAPPEAEVIRLARKATGMTAEDAAAASKAHDPAGKGVSATYWRDVERGSGGRRGKRVTTRASDRILAAMARVVGVTPGQLAGAGREDAARVLEEMLRREGHAAGPAPPPVLAAVPAEPADDIADVRMLLEGIDRLQIPIRGEFYRIMEIVRQFPPGVIIPGVVIFADDRYARSWDDKIGSLYADGQVVTPARAAVSVALEQYRDRRQAEQGNTATGLAPPPAREVTSR